MSAKQSAKQTTSSSAPVYNSNPFTLAFDALGRFFNTNAGWAIAVIIIGFLSFMGQFTSNILQSNQRRPDLSYSTPSPISHPSTDATTIIAIGVVVFVVLVVFLSLAITISTFIQSMFIHVALESEKGNSVTFSEAFQAVSKRFWRILGATFLAAFKIMGWFLLLIVPGVIAVYRYALLGYVIMDESEENKSVKASHDRVKALTKDRLFEVFGVSTVAGIIPFVGSLLGLSGKAALYRQLQVYHDKKLEKPTIHWLNYIGILLFVVIILLILAFGALVALSSK